MKNDRPIFREDESSQIPALQLLQNLGFTYLTQEEALRLRAGSIRNVILEDVLEAQLRKINKIRIKEGDFDFRDPNIANAIHELKSVPYEGLIKTSEKIFELITLGKSYSETILGDTKSYNFRYIDWDNWKNNVYHVTEEFNVEVSTYDGNKRRPDLVLFVNGIPLAIIECKRTDINKPVREAVEQHIRNQKNHEIPHLYVFSQILAAISPTNLNSETNRCLYATTGTDRPYWFPWMFPEKKQKKIFEEIFALVNKPLSPDKKTKMFSGRFSHIAKYFEELEKHPRQLTDQDQIIYGLFQPAKLLELIKEFILYDGGSKKIARYQQYFSVKDTLSRIGSFDSSGNRPSGVVWHTQGSGKSLSMVMLAKAIAMEIDNPKVILVTDRIDLDDQIYRTFQNCSVPLKQANSGADLIEILQQNRSSVIATTLQKFDIVASSKEVVLDSPDIVILVDEAHRSHYGESNSKVHKVFPRACFVGYTGTPLTKREKNTMSKFGRIIGVPYTNRDALRDNAVVPLLYEGRMVPEEISNDLLDRWFDRITQGLTEEQKADLKQKYNRADQLAKVDQRIFMISADISQHFAMNWKGKGFKGQLAVDSIASACKYKDFFDELGEVTTAVIVSKTDDRRGHTSVTEEENAIQRHERMIREQYGNERRYERSVKEKFDSEDAPEILIVVWKLLTGFDVPRNTILYVDKNLEGHTLLQATARVNRTFPKKDFGYIIDYHGNLTNFIEAIAHYDKLADKEKYGEFDDEERREIQSAIHNIAEEIEQLPQRYADVAGIFSSIQNRLDLRQYEDLLFDKDDREKFYEKLGRFGRTLHTALSSSDFYAAASEDKIRHYKEELKFFENLKVHLKGVFAEVIDYSDYEPKIEKILNAHVHAGEVQTVVPLFPIYDKRFEDELKNKDATSKALTILHRTRRYIEDNLDRDRAFFERFSKLLEDTLGEYQERRLSEKKLLEKAEELKEKVLSRSGDELPEELSENDEAKAYFGIIKRELEKSDKFDGGQKPAIAQLSLRIDEIIRENIIVDWTKNIDVQNDIKNKIEDCILAKKEDYQLSMDFDTLDRMLEELIKTAKVRCYR